MSDFEINEGMANFNNLNDASNLYNEIFSLWDQYNKIFSLSYKTIFYEDIIYKFDSTLKNLLLFLELNWEENIRNFNQTALLRNKINTPSYSQVIEPLYSKSISRWKRYGEMQIIEKKLNYWIKKFNYNNLS